jgi:hypothetical protein
MIALYFTQSLREVMLDLYNNQKPKHPILMPVHFRKRLLNALGWASLLIAGGLFLGSAGYHFTENISWLDATLNASMILTGMGPTIELKTAGGKLFAIFYSLFSGLIFLTVASILLSPGVHRMLHRFHLETQDN